MRRPSGDTRGCSSSSGDCVSRRGMRSASGSGGSTRNRSHCRFVGSAMREHDAAVRGPRRRALVAVELEHPLWHTSTRVRQIEIESLAAICDKDQMRLPSEDHAGSRSDSETRVSSRRVATIRSRRPDPIEDHDGQPLAVGRPGGIAHTGGDRSAHWATSASTHSRIAVARRRPALGVVARRCDQAALPSVVIIMTGCSRCGTSMSLRWPYG